MNEDEVVSAGICVPAGLEYLFEEAVQFKRTIEAGLAERAEPLSFAEATYYILGLGVAVPGHLMPKVVRGAIQYYREPADE